MIIARLDGGLGNQMFQYAAARALAERHDTELGLDLRVYDGPSQFDYGLDHFAITGRILDGSELPPSRKANRIRYLMWRAGLVGPDFLDQKDDAFQDGFLAAKPDTYLRGYWQSERYFADVAEIIRNEFRITTPATPENLTLADQIRSSNSVSMHIRRGDYVSDPLANATHGLCTMEYYTAALEKVSQATGALPHVFAFSDDPSWARENLEIGAPFTVVDLNDSDHQYEDLRLMSICRNHIIANSSFSWWGAWLNGDETKTVVAPRTWFRDPSKLNPDICPPEWIRI